MTGSPKRGTRLTYANVVATLALFLALGGGAVWAVDKIGSREIKNKAVKTRHLAGNAVTTAKLKGNAITGAKIRGGAVGLSDIGAGVLSGKIILRASASNIAGVTTDPPSNLGVALPLQGTTTFTPVADRSYGLMLEMRGEVVDGDGPGGQSCTPGIDLWVNDRLWQGRNLLANADIPAQFQVPVATGNTIIGLTTTGQPQTISARLYGDSGCGPSSTIDALRVYVVEYT